MAIEFEVTKEPEGKRVFFWEAKKHKSGTVVLTLPDGVAEQGKYLIHITLLQDNRERLDAHMNFKAGAYSRPASRNTPTTVGIDAAKPKLIVYDYFF